MLLPRGSRESQRPRRALCPRPLPRPGDQAGSSEATAHTSPCGFSVGSLACLCSGCVRGRGPAQDGLLLTSVLPGWVGDDCKALSACPSLPITGTPRDTVWSPHGQPAGAWPSPSVRQKPTAQNQGTPTLGRVGPGQGPSQEQGAGGQGQGRPRPQQGRRGPGGEDSGSSSSAWTCRDGWTAGFAPLPGRERN